MTRDFEYQTSTGVFEARYSSECPSCKQHIFIKDHVVFSGGKVHHAGCKETICQKCFLTICDCDKE